VSNPEHSPSGESMEALAFGRLEEAVAGTLARMTRLRDDLSEAQRQGRNMQELLRKFTGGEEDPTELAGRLREMESANEDLLERLAKGRAGVERLLARIRFLEEQG
jgi:hypothetical protein